MATPFVAGVAALMFDANPSLTPSQIKAAITSTAEDWRSAGADVDTGAGRLQAYEAIKAGASLSGGGPLVPKHYFASTPSIRTAKARDVYRFSVTSLSYPVALTLIDPGATSTNDFDLYVYAPDGSLRASSTTSNRQDTAAFTPTVTGTYSTIVISYAGSGTYYLDFSYGGSAPSLSSDG